MKPNVLLLSCEHAVNTVPTQYMHLFNAQKQRLQSHEGIDFGAKEITTHLSEHFACEAVFATVTRLLIDCNRSLANKQCFSQFTNHLPLADKQHLIAQYYFPYRQQVENMIKHHIFEGKQVLHLSIHSFTPELNGAVRNAGLSFLYDPKRHGEKEVAREWLSILNQLPPSYRVRLNYPYRGTSDGFTTALRKIYTEDSYLGLEIEVNQALLIEQESSQTVMKTLTHSLSELFSLL